MYRVLMCRPNYFNVEYDINPWMSNQFNKVEILKSYDQWHYLYSRIKPFADIEIVDSVKNLPDLVFTANAGFVFDNKVILSNFAKFQRQPESKYYEDWFVKNNFEVIKIKSYYEGEGDHLLDSLKRHWVGYGFRTEQNACNELSEILKTKVNSLELVDSRFYHLDTCFCPLPNGELLYYPNAFSISSQKLIEKSFSKIINISEQDALCFACNAVCLGYNIVIPKNNKVSYELKKCDYVIHSVDMSEFMKAGGAAKCLVLNLFG